MAQKFDTEEIVKLEAVVNEVRDEVVPNMLKGIEAYKELADETGSGSFIQTGSALEESAQGMSKIFSEWCDAMDRLIKYAKQLNIALG